MGQRDIRSSVRADLSAKAELSARAELKGEIPPDVIRKSADALLDLLSPFTEIMGLIGDHVRRHRRAVLNKIGERWKELAAIEQAPLNPIPTKLMVPLLEKATLEDLESEMLDRWAHLLVSAATDYDTILLAHVDTLSRLGPKEAGLLESWCRDFDFDLEDFILNYERDKATLRRCLLEAKSQQRFMDQHNTGATTKIMTIRVSGEETWVSYAGSTFFIENELAIAVLLREKLLEEDTLSFTQNADLETQIVTVRMATPSAIGVDLVKRTSQRSKRARRDTLSAGP